MIKNKAYITFICFFICLAPFTVKAQFINIEIDIKAELTASVTQDLDFGTITKNSGLHTINLDDVAAGVFAIRAFMAQSIYVVIRAPEHLTYTETGTEYKIPLSLQSAYNNYGSDNPFNTMPLPNNRGFIQQMADNNNTDDRSSLYWDDIYLYIYGSINVGDVPDGIYEADILMEIEYE